MLPTIKDEGDPLESGSYKAIKLLEHGKKIMEKVIKSRIREQMKIGEVLFDMIECQWSW